jgi:hypothetical protein
MNKMNHVRIQITVLYIYGRPSSQLFVLLYFCQSDLTVGRT